MPTVKFSDNPNEETAFVTQDGGQRNRAVLTAVLDGTIKYPDNPNSTKVTVTVDGVERKAVAVVNIDGSGGGGDSHNKGYYATLNALEEAYPTAEAGDWAIVGATDTVWIWDTDTNAWVDSDQKGQVTSVNGKTGAVTIGANDVLPTQTGYSGRVLGTDGFVAGWVKPEIVQRAVLPVASQDEEGNIYQFVGTTDANYTNGYFYECISDGGNPATYSWTRVDVQPAGSSLPSQTGNAGKFLTTDGTNASWGNALTNTGTGLACLAAGTGATTTDDLATAIGENASAGYCCTVVGSGASASATSYGSVVIGPGSSVTGSSADSGGTILIGASRSVNKNCIIIGGMQPGVPNYQGGIFLNATSTNINYDGADVRNTFWITVGTNSQYSKYQITDANGHFPAARMADTTSAAQGQVLTLDSNLNAVWASGGGGGGIQNTATGTDSLTILGTAATGNYATNTGVLSEAGTNATAYGYHAIASGTSSCAFGEYSEASGARSLAIGDNAYATANDAIQLGASGGNNSDANTFKVYNGNDNYEMMSADGTIPTARLTKVNSTVTLTAAGWSGGSQTVTVTGMTATGVVLVSPDPTDQAAYTSAGIMCTAQAANSLTFTCSTTPSADIDVNVVML